MALALAPDRFGRLLDPLGRPGATSGAGACGSLHPLSFVEDPTRVFRAARYASRLGFRPDAATRAAIRLAVERPGYAALSGQRLWREIELAAAEPRARLVFELLVRWRATSLWNLDGASIASPGRRPSGSGAGRSRRAWRWTRPSSPSSR